MSSFKSLTVLEPSHSIVKLEQPSVLIRNLNTLVRRSKGESGTLQKTKLHINWQLRNTHKSVQKRKVSIEALIRKNRKYLTSTVYRKECFHRYEIKH